MWTCFCLRLRCDNSFPSDLVGLVFKLKSKDVYKCLPALATLCWDCACRGNMEMEGDWKVFS